MIEQLQADIQKASSRLLLFFRGTYVAAFYLVPTCKLVPLQAESDAAQLSKQIAVLDGQINGWEADKAKAEDVRLSFAFLAVFFPRRFQRRTCLQLWECSRYAS